MVIVKIANNNNIVLILTYYETSQTNFYSIIFRIISSDVPLVALGISSICSQPIIGSAEPFDVRLHNRFLEAILKILHRRHCDICINDFDFRFLLMQNNNNMKICTYSFD